MPTAVMTAISTMVPVVAAVVGSTVNAATTIATTSYGPGSNRPWVFDKHWKHVFEHQLNGHGRMPVRGEGADNNNQKVQCALPLT